jgi:cation diffusion facilitator family transporter
MAEGQLSADHIEVSCLRKSAWGCGIIGVLAAAACVWTDSCTLLIEAFLYLVDAAVAIASVAIVRRLEMPPDEHFHFGYHKLEPAVINASATLLVAGSVIAVLFAIQDIRHADNIESYPIALGFAAAATIISAALWLRIRAAQSAVDSPLLKTEALTWGIAAIESIGVLAGFVIAWALEHQPGPALQGLAPYIDPVMAIIISLAILKEPLKTYWESSSDLLDASFQSDTTKQVRERVAAILAQRYPLIPVHAVRLRRAGRKLFVHVEFTPHNDLTMVEVRSLQSEIEAAIRAVRPETLLVTFGH